MAGLLAMVFMLGMMMGFCVFLVFGLHAMHKAKKAAEKRLKSAAKSNSDRGVGLLQDENAESIIKRLHQAQDITKQQMDLQGALDQPSKNALHSRYKNGLGVELQRLEEEKWKVLQSILDDGFDPLINVLSEAGTAEEINLSKFLSTKSASPPSPPPGGPKKASKFVILKGGKDDGTAH